MSLAALAAGFPGAGDVAQAQGGCGALCMPPDLLNPARIFESGPGRFRFYLFNEYADFDNFYESGDPVNNPGGASAIINVTTLDANVTVSRRLALDVIVPWVRKTQQSNRFGQRRAEGIGDVAVIGNFLLTRPQGVHRLSARLGFKFATGDIQEPDGPPKLPSPFQVGSGAEDLLVGANYFRAFQQFNLYVNWLSRVPLAGNTFQYEFGDEHRIHSGLEITPGEKRLLTLLAGVAFNRAGHDRTRGTDVPARLRDGETVLNTGGTWLDFAPGVRLNLPKQWFVQTRFQLPLYEDWHGDRSRIVGQVRPDFRWQLSLGFQLSPERRGN